MSYWRLFWYVPLVAYQKMSLDTAVNIINQLLPEPHSSLLAGMLFGVRRTIPTALYDDLITTGTIHVVALSGMNITILVRVLFDGLGSILGKIWGVCLTLVGITVFVWFVGPSPTVVRAAFMGGISVLAVYFGRKDIPLLSLVLTALTMLVYDHTLFTNVSFQLSFAATLGILLFGSKPSALKLKQQMQSGKLSFTSGLPQKVKSYLVSFAVWTAGEFRVTLSAQLFTVPLIIYHFRQVSLIAPLANVLTGWLVPWIMYLGFLAVFASLLSGTVGHVFALLVWVPLTVFIYLVELCAQIPGAAIPL